MKAVYKVTSDYTDAKGFRLFLNETLEKYREKRFENVDLECKLFLKDFIINLYFIIFFIYPSLLS